MSGMQQNVINMDVRIIWREFICIIIVDSVLCFKKETSELVQTSFVQVCSTSEKLKLNLNNYFLFCRGVR